MVVVVEVEVEVVVVVVVVVVESVTSHGKGPKHVPPTSEIIVIMTTLITIHMGISSLYIYIYTYTHIHIHIYTHVKDFNYDMGL